MRTKCKHFTCGCFRFEEDQWISECGPVRCYCKHTPEDHFHTCFCGAERFCGLCPWTIINWVLLAGLTLLGFWAAR